AAAAMAPLAPLAVARVAASAPVAQMAPAILVTVTGDRLGVCRVVEGQAHTRARVPTTLRRDRVDVPSPRRGEGSSMSGARSMGEGIRLFRRALDPPHPSIASIERVALSPLGRGHIGAVRAQAERTVSSHCAHC